MIKRSLLLALAALFALAVPAQPVRAANSAAAIADFDAAFSKINDYSFNLRSHEVKGTDTQDRVYQYTFMKPHFAKTLILTGDGRGSGGVWSGGDTVSGHQGGILAGIHLNVSLHDGRATSLLGYTIPDGLIQNIVAGYKSTAGEIAQRAGGKIDGVPTDLVELKVANPSANGGISRMTIYFSQATHWPLRNIYYVGDKPILDQSFLNVKTNTGLKQSDF
jgi:outer membrane lipoprotein-sorting protein